MAGLGSDHISVRPKSLFSQTFVNFELETTSLDKTSIALLDLIITS